MGSGASTVQQYGPYVDTSTESSNDTFGSNGLHTGGTDVVTAWDRSTLTLSTNVPSTLTTTVHTTESSSLSNVTSTQTISSTDTLTGSSTDDGTITSTETYLKLTNCRLGLVINFGADMIGEGISRVVNGLPLSE